MKIIDAHVHYSKIASFEHCAQNDSKVDYSLQGYQNETEMFEVVGSVCMGLTENSPAAFPDARAKTPMFADLTEKMPKGMKLCLGINPHAVTQETIDKTGELICGSGDIVGFKIYAGYYHFDVNDQLYDPVYKLASKHDLTVAVHSGSTYSEKGLLKYAQPLSIDELAVSYPDMRIVICHMGVPWIYDACEVVAKNKNVYTDLSGMLVGNAELIGSMTQNQLLIERYRQALVYLNEYDKLLYGTDWPLVPMGAYIDFIKRIVPAEYYEEVFYKNAVKVYKLDV